VLARLLLEAGADPNDGQALYNRMFSDNDDHLRLLLNHGLGTGDGGPWRARLAGHLDRPSEMVAGQMWWAVTHDQSNRVRLLAEHGADLAMRDADGHTPADVAALNGSPEIVEVLVARGGPAPALAGQDALLAAVMGGDATAVAQAGSEATSALRRERPWLIVWAAARRRHAAVALLLEHGFDVNAYGRGDVPSGMHWETALHCAAFDGDLELIETLLAAGADLTLRDARFDGTPLDWALHEGQAAAAAALESR
jgi:rhodanese-related sulfurtransferase